MLEYLWNAMPFPWNLGLFLGMLSATVGLGIKMYNPDRGNVPTTEGMAGELMGVLGIVVCVVIVTNAPRPHNPATCVACSTDQQQMSRPSYDWTYRNFILDQEGGQNGS